MVRLIVRTEEGSFARRLAQLPAVTAGQPTVFEPRKPIGSIAAFFAAEAGSWSETGFWNNLPGILADLAWIPALQLIGQVDWSSTLERRISAKGIGAPRQAHPNRRPMRFPPYQGTSLGSERARAAHPKSWRSRLPMPSGASGHPERYARTWVEDETG